MAVRAQDKCYRQLMWIYCTTDTVPREAHVPTVERVLVFWQALRTAGILAAK